MKKSFKTICTIYFNTLLFLTKIPLTFITLLCLNFFIKTNSVVAVLIWVTISVIADVVLIFSPPDFFTKTTLTEEEQSKYGLSSEEFIKFLSFSTKIRLFRSIFITFIAMAASTNNFVEFFLKGLMISFIIVEPIIRIALKIKTPYSSKTFLSSSPSPSLDNSRFDVCTPGSGAWTAEQNLRQATQLINKHRL